MHWAAWLALLVLAFMFGISVMRTILGKTVDCMHHDPRKAWLRESDPTSISFIRERMSAVGERKIFSCCRCGHRWIDQGDL